jgi:acetyl-CoA carboxylase biotin carboxyl carrier protein
MSGLKIDHEHLRNIATVMAETGLSELEWSDGDQHLRLSRMPPPQMVAAVQPAATAPAAPLEAAEAAPSAPTAAPAGSVTSPMVGTAYLAPEPGAGTFVRLGDPVAEGDTLLIIEAMKVMNPIRAPHAGTVTRIHVQDAQPVEFGEILMQVE